MPGEANRAKYEAGLKSLTELLEGALDSGADMVQLEREREGLEVVYFSGNTGVGGFIKDKKTENAIISCILENTKGQRRASRKMTMTLHGQPHTVRVKEYETFGELAFELRISVPKS